MPVTNAAPVNWEERFQLEDQDGDGTMLAVFVHGLGGQVDSYWGQTRKLLTSDKELRSQGIRFAFWGYPTSVTPQGPRFMRLLASRSRLPNVRELGGLLWNDLMGGELRRFDRIALFGHSLGGLVVQAAACKAMSRAEEERTRLVATGLCASPTAGSKLADLVSKMSKLWGGNVQFKDLAVESEERNILQAEFVNNVVHSNGPQVSVRVWYAIEDPIVTKSEVDALFRYNVIELAGDHSSCIQTNANVGVFKDWIIGALSGEGRPPATVARSSPEYVYLRELAGLYSRRPEGYTESVELLYLVSETGHDVAEQTIHIRSTEPVVTKRMAFGSTQEVDNSRGFEDLAVTLSLPEGVSALLAPMDEGASIIECVVFFNPPIVGTHVFSVRHLWKGCWDPLRSSQVDEGAFVANDSTTEMRITVEFPAGTENIKITPTSGDEVEISYNSQGVRPSAVIVYNNPRPGEHRYYVEARLPSVG